MTVAEVEKLAETLAAHEQWLAGEDGGTRADLRGADLARADLRGADLADANLRGANLRGANLADANLRDANLRGADLADADLRDANLRGANLADANLTDANLRGADLADANLRDANLTGANLRGANLTGANLTTGETWETYVNEVVPQLLLAGERGIEAFKQWGGHKWTDCPMHVAFNITSVDQAPALLRPRVEQFIYFYDQGLIAAPEPAPIADAESSTQETTR